MKALERCKRCGKENPAEIHTCTPGFHFTEEEKKQYIDNEQLGKKY